MSIKSGKKALFTEINITPLTDIFLVLLIIMMVVAPTFNSVDNNINMPVVNSGVAVDNDKVIVSVTKDGSVYVNNQKTSVENLSESLASCKTDSKAEVIVKADEKVKSAIIMDIMDAAQDAQYKKLVVAGEPLTKKDQKMLEKDQSLIQEEKSLTPLPQDNSYDDWSE